MANIDSILEDISSYSNPEIDNKSSYLSDLENVINEFEKKEGNFFHQQDYLIFSFSKSNLADKELFGSDLHGVKLFRSLKFYNKIEGVLKKKLPEYNYILPSRFYNFNERGHYNTCINKISIGFPILLRQLIINVINNRRYRYDAKYEYIIYNRLLNFDFIKFASRIELMSSRIIIPKFKVSDIDSRIANQSPMHRFFNILDKTLIDDIVKIHMQEWEAYFNSSILVYYLNKFKIDINNDSVDILINLMRYSNKSLYSSKFNKLIIKILRKYYKNKYNGLLFAFPFKNIPFNLVDFSEVPKFNIYEFNNYENSKSDVLSSINRKNENKPISFDLDFNFLKSITNYFEIKQLESKALGGFETWANMDGHKFEHEMLDFFTKYLGIKGEVTRGSGDFGIDIVLNKNIAVQCKNHAKKVSPGSVRDFLGGCKDKGYHKMIFVSTNGYSEESKRFAINNGIKILNIQNVVDVIQGRTTKEDLLQYLAID